MGGHFNSRNLDPVWCWTFVSHGTKATSEQSAAASDGVSGSAGTVVGWQSCSDPLWWGWSFTSHGIKATGEQIAAASHSGSGSVRTVVGGQTCKEVSLWLRSSCGVLDTKYENYFQNKDIKRERFYSIVIVRWDKLPISISNKQ